MGVVAGGEQDIACCQAAEWLQMGLAANDGEQVVSVSWQDFTDIEQVASESDCGIDG